MNPIYKTLLDGVKKYGSTENDIVSSCMRGTTPESFYENVVVAPWWEPDGFGWKGDFLTGDDQSSIKVWNIPFGDTGITFVKTGIGAPVHMDVILALGLTKCKRIVFVGSVGALDEQIGIGDIMIPEVSICGTGANRFLCESGIADQHCFGEKCYPDPELNALLVQKAENICHENDVRYHSATVFSIDTVLAQFAHIDEILALGVNCIEMETAAAFMAAKIAGLPICALFSVSDNTMKHKSLISGRNREEQEYRHFVRREIFPKIIREVFGI